MKDRPRSVNWVHLNLLNAHIHTYTNIYIDMTVNPKTHVGSARSLMTNHSQIRTSGFPPKTFPHANHSSAVYHFLQPAFRRLLDAQSVIFVCF